MQALANYKFAVTFLGLLLKSTCQGTKGGRVASFIRVIEKVILYKCKEFHLILTEFGNVAVNFVSSVLCFFGRENNPKISN